MRGIFPPALCASLSVVSFMIAHRSYAEPPLATRQEPQVAAPAVSFALEHDYFQDDEIVVSAPQREIPVPAPRGESRSISERMESRRAWDRCALRAQDSDPFDFQNEAPEESCSRALGMSDRHARPRR